MPVFSACILAQGGGIPLEETLRSCLGQFEEITVSVPAGQPAARELASRYTSRVWDYDPAAGPRAALENAFAEATGDYLLWLREGDAFAPPELSKLRALRHALHGETGGVRMKDDRVAGGPETAPYYRYELRIAAKSAPYAWADDANPVLLLESGVATFGIAVTHRQDAPEHYAAGLAYYQGLLARNGALSPREQLYYARAQRDSGSAPEAVEAYEHLLYAQNAPDELRAAACLELAACQTDDELRLDTLLYSLRFQAPQADVCCGIGAYLLQKERYAEAAHWYEQALAQKPPVSDRPVYTDYYGYVPALQLCRCWYALGQPLKAERYNRIAGEYKPGDPSVHGNEQFFAGLRAQKR